MLKNLTAFQLTHVTIQFLRVFFIEESLVEYVDNWPHLGYIFSNTCDDSVDIMNRHHLLCKHVILSVQILSLK